jgi:hypothetical protein
MTKPLSPAARAVLDAAFSAYWSAEQEAPNDEGMIAAAALRAAADQVVPETHAGFARHSIRLRLLAIAAELEGGND